jgi:hypothetical protein
MILENKFRKKEFEIMLGMPIGLLYARGHAQRRAFMILKTGNYETIYYWR